MKRRGLPRGAAPTPLPAWCQAQRRAQGRRHALCTVLAIAAGAILCGMRGHKAIADWAQSLGPKARQRYGRAFVFLTAIGGGFAIGVNW